MLIILYDLVYTLIGVLLVTSDTISILLELDDILPVDANGFCLQ